MSPGGCHAHAGQPAKAMVLSELGAGVGMPHGGRWLRGVGCKVFVEDFTARSVNAGKSGGLGCMNNAA